MKKISFLLSLLIFSALGPQARSAEKKTWDDLRGRLESAVKRSSVSREQLSVLVLAHEGKDDVEVFGVQADRPRIPASLTKIFTAATVLKKLAPNHQFLTELYGSKAVDGVMTGPLYLKGGGDPSFVSENMWFLANEFVRHGVTEVKGGIVVDDTLFDDDLFPSRGSKRVDRAYDAPIGAMSFNWNAVNVFLRPGPKKDAAIRVLSDPENEYIMLKNVAKTSEKKFDIAVSRGEIGNRDQIVVSGEMPFSAAEKVYYKSVSNPALWSGYNLKSFLAQRGVRVEGEIRTGKVPANADLMAQSKSKPLSLIVADLMKFSNNYVAEMLVKYLSLSPKNTVGNLPAGMEEIRDFMVALGYKRGDFVLENASGLTTENQVSVEQIVKALVFLRKRFDLIPEFMASLPIAGIDGTLKNRMSGTEAERWIRAKTGLLSGVVGLGGYAGRSDGVVLSFAFLYNGKKGHEDKVRDLFDRMAVELVR